VVRNQRDRLMGATVAVVAERGYETMRVADILELAGISRSAYYQHFANKEECFLATLDALIALAAAPVVEAYRSADGPLEERFRAALDAVVQLIDAQPAAARACFVEAYAAGGDAVQRLEVLGDRLERATTKALRESSAHAGMPPQLVRAVLGGVRQVVHKRLRQGREEELTELSPELVEWALGYGPPTRPLRRPRKAPVLPPASADPDSQRARILAAVTDAVAEKGYQSLVISEIAQRGAVSLSTFYSLFDGKGDVFVAAIEDAERRLTETVVPHYEQASDWPHAIKDSMHAVFAFLATNPAAAKLGGMDVFSAGPAALARQDRTQDSFAALLYPGFQAYPSAAPIAVESIGGAISALVFQQLRRAGPERLYEVCPTAIYLALGPFLGIAEATAIANEDWRPA
jgi:AcrR family transcriptional regulator